MHYAFGDMGELEEAMRGAFYDYFKKDIKVTKEIGVMLPSSNEAPGPLPMKIEDILEIDAEFSLWELRDRRWEPGKLTIQLQFCVTPQQHNTYTPPMAHAQGLRYAVLYPLF